MSVQFTLASTSDELQQVIALQGQNHAAALAEETKASQGFVWAKHSVSVLQRMNHMGPSVIAKDDDRVVGYCLMMPRAFEAEVPALVPMFQMLDDLEWRGQALRHSSRWFVMGQVCVAATHRGTGVFQGMYQHLRNTYRDRYDFLVTEVAAANARSMRAHTRLGFQVLGRHVDAQAWNILLWDF